MVLSFILTTFNSIALHRIMFPHSQAVDVCLWTVWCTNYCWQTRPCGPHLTVKAWPEPRPLRNGLTQHVTMCLRLTAAVTDWLRPVDAGQLEREVLDVLSDYFVNVWDSVEISGFRRGVNEILDLLRRYSSWIGSQSPTFQDNLSVPSARSAWILKVGWIVCWLSWNIGKCQCKGKGEGNLVTGPGGPIGWVEV
jgi:hypothetical protein